MIRLAEPEDADFIRSLWFSPENALWLDPPDNGAIERAIAERRIHLWDQGGLCGFAYLVEWLDGVWSMRSFATTRPGIGRPFLAAVLAEMFGNRRIHRLGLDCTADNARALQFFTAGGFTREGVWRECWQRPDGGWIDCIFMSMLNREWQALAAGATRA